MSHPTVAALLHTPLNRPVPKWASRYTSAHARRSMASKHLPESIMRKSISLWVGILALGVSAAAQAAGPQGDGPQIRFDERAWEGLRGRLSVGTSSPLRSDFGGADTEPQKVSSMSVMGDYYFNRSWFGSSGGLRATSGLVLGSPGSLWSSPYAVDRRSAHGASPRDGMPEANSTLPYVGLGYTGLFRKGLGLSADVGVMALNPRSSVRLGSQSLDDTMRDLRFTPLLQVGVSYAF